MFKDYKRLSLAAIADSTHINYQKLQYFFSERSWDIKALNDVRVALLQNQRTTRAYHKGVLAIDDTACPNLTLKKLKALSFNIAAL